MSDMTRMIAQRLKHLIENHKRYTNSAEHSIFWITGRLFAALC